MTGHRATALLALLVVTLAAGACTHSKPAAGRTAAPQPTYTAPPTALPVSPSNPPASPLAWSTAPPPWLPPAVIANGAQSAAFVEAAGLPYAQEMLTVHYHAHLDVIVNDNKVVVPPYIGMVSDGHKILGLSPLHTHDESGVLHIENAVPATFLLGQVFVEWGVRFTSTCLGPYCTGGGNEMAVFVNGKRYGADPTRIVLTKHEEIAVVFGAAGHLPPAPASYHFSSGE